MGQQGSFSTFYLFFGIFNGENPSFRKKNYFIFSTSRGGFQTWILSKDVVLAVQYSKYSKFT